MFVTIGTMAQYMGEDAGASLIVSGIGREATAAEAAECISRYVVNGDPHMHEANAEFSQKYSKKLSAADVIIPLPNGKVQSVQSILRGMANE